jgi:hypothetical protein
LDDGVLNSPMRLVALPYRDDSVILCLPSAHELSAVSEMYRKKVLLKESIEGIDVLPNTGVDAHSIDHRYHQLRRYRR